jgi:hypothetical protein
MIRRSTTLIFALFAVAALPALAAAGRYAITTEQVAAAVTSSGMQVSPDQVALLTSAVAVVEAPGLRVQSIEHASGQRTLARMECLDAQQCLPFVVALHPSQIALANAGSGAAAQLAPPVSQARPSPIAVRAGSPTTLLLDGAHVHISLSVICLENGAPGQTVRATDRDRRQFYTARVAQNGTLEGRL